MRVSSMLVALVASPAFAAAAWAAPDGVLDDAEAARAEVLASDLTVRLATLCPAGSEADMLGSIAAATEGVEIEVVAAALQSLSQNTELCEAARAALGAANQAAQLAMASTSGATGATGAPTAPGTQGFSTGGVGAPGGGGGSGYTPG